MSTLKANTISTNDANNVALDNSLKLKNYTTTQRDALTSVAGDTIYNTTENKVQYYTGTEWLNTGSADLVGDLEYIATMDYSSSSAGSGQNVLTTANGGSLNVGAYDEFVIFLTGAVNSGSYNMNFVQSGRNADSSGGLGSNLYSKASYEVRAGSSTLTIGNGAQTNNYNSLTPTEFRTASYANSQATAIYRVKNFSHNGYMPVSNIKFIYQGASAGYRNTASWFETSAEVGSFYIGGYTSANWLYKIHIYGVKG
tara:strand:+ start:276 stop:1040 length:765 start_codon:yes stop_codon:yes gene_type:complete